MKDINEHWILNFASTHDSEIYNLSENSEYNILLKNYNKEIDFDKNNILMFSPSIEIEHPNNRSGSFEFKCSSNSCNMEMDFENQKISDFVLNFDTELNKKSGNIESNIPTNKNATPDYDYIINPNKNLFQKNEENIPEDEKVPDKVTIPEISLLQKKLDRSYKLEGQFLNFEEKKESHTKSSNKRKKELQELKQITFKVIYSPNYLRSGNDTKIISYRSSNCKNKILRNLFQNIFIVWIQIPNNPKLKKLSKIYLEIIYVKYKEFKYVKLKEIYSGDCFKKYLGTERKFFEDNKEAIKASSVSMKTKLDFTFQQAFNSFYNKTNILSKDGDILSGLKSKDEYIKEHNKNNEQNVKELFEKNMEILFNNINDEKA